jgi:hypothetical protein
MLAEFRVKRFDQIDTIHARWEDLPATRRPCAGEQEAAEHAAHLADDPHVYEVRWNWENYEQGHYVIGSSLPF